MTTYRRCSVIGDNGLRCKNLTYLEDELCFTHASRARKDKQRLPSYGGGVLSKYEARTRTEPTPVEHTGLSVEPVTRTEASDGFIEWDDDEHIDPLDRVEALADEDRRYWERRWGG